MESCETYEHAGVTVEIVYDDDCRSPREDDNVATLVCWHPDYILGDYQLRDGSGRGAVDDVFETERGRTDFASMKVLYRYLTLMCGARRVTPLYLYDHSGISIRAGAPSPWDNPTVRRDEFGQGMGWDTSMVGFAYCTDERLTELCGEEAKYHTDEWIDKVIAGEVAHYDEYLTGQCYGYIVAPGSEDQEACWGYIGDPDAEGGVKAEANGIAESIAADRAERRRVERMYLFAPESMEAAR